MHGKQVHHVDLCPVEDASSTQQSINSSPATEHLLTRPRVTHAWFLLTPSSCDEGLFAAAPPAAARIHLNPPPITIGRRPWPHPTAAAAPLLFFSAAVSLTSDKSSTNQPASTVNDPSAGSPTETLLRLLLPLNDQVWTSFRLVMASPPMARDQTGRAQSKTASPKASLNHSIGSSDGRCVQRAGT